MPQAEMERRALTHMDVVDAVSWDHRKELASLWQDHCPLPDGGLSERLYDALIAVARWGAESAWEYADAEPLSNPPASPIRGEVDRD